VHSYFTIWSEPGEAGSLLEQALEQINLMTPLYFYRHRKRASVCRSVPPLTRGGQEGFAAVKWALGCDLPPQTPLIPHLSGGKWAIDRFHSHPDAGCMRWLWEYRGIIKLICSKKSEGKSKNRARTTAHAYHHFFTRRSRFHASVFFTQPLTTPS
jgi:hypothetical protein